MLYSASAAIIRRSPFLYLAPTSLATLKVNPTHPLYQPPSRITLSLHNHPCAGATTHQPTTRQHVQASTTHLAFSPCSTRPSQPALSILTHLRIQDPIRTATRYVNRASLQRHPHSMSPKTRHLRRLPPSHTLDHLSMLQNSQRLNNSEPITLQTSTPKKCHALPPLLSTQPTQHPHRSYTSTSCPRRPSTRHFNLLPFVCAAHQSDLVPDTPLPTPLQSPPSQSTTNLPINRSS